jgi:hypothetical protein
MTITTLQLGTTSEDSESAELLIKEARQLGRRRRLGKGVAIFAFLVAIATLISASIYYSQSKRPTTSANRGVSVSEYPRCTPSQLSVKSEGQVGAGGTDGAVLLFRNVSSHACSLAGFPNVEAIGKSGASITASHVSNDMLGGLNWAGTPPPSKPPTVVLTNKGRVASDWYQYSENGPAGYTLFRASILRVRLPGSKSEIQVRGSVDAAEGRMVVTPFVPGKTGTENVGAVKGT